MKIDKNPFLTRASEYIDLDDKFIKLFSPEILNIFNDYPIWNTVNVFRSSPGGGKTTLLKIFTVKILKNIKERCRYDEQCEEIFKILQELGVYDSNEKIIVAGSLLSFNNEYVSLEFLELNETQKINFFFSLLNTRIILSILNSIALIHDLKSPGELDRIIIKTDDHILIPNSVRSLTTGAEFYEWACSLEEKICNEIDSIYKIDTEFIEGSSSLFALDLFSPKNLWIDGHQAISRVMVMLDDVHNLSTFQRAHLLKSIIDKRPLVNTWVSERLQALTMDEIFSEGSIEGRDSHTIQLENYWSKKYHAFERFAKSVSNKRVAAVFEDRQEFSSFLSSEFDEKDEKKITKAFVSIKDRIINDYSHIEKYQKLISEKELTASEITYENLVTWKETEILFYRDFTKPQKLLFDIDIDSEQKDIPDVRGAAKLFINEEYGVSYYFGISNICRLASSNIEQFLSLAAKLFDDILLNSVKKIVNPNIKLEISPGRQEEVIKRFVSRNKWDDLNTKVPNSSEIKRFIDSIGSFCRYETYLPNAWNTPGINGISITMSERKMLKDVALKNEKHPYHSLAKCIAICISYNLLDFKLNHRNKGKDLMLLYINRIYCAKYNLPMNNGKFKEKPLSALLNWYNKGYQEPKQNKLNL